MPVVEIGLMRAKPNHAVMVKTRPESQILERTWDTVANSAAGPHWVFGGTEIRDDSKLWGFFEFESVEHHAEFASTFGAEAVKDLPKILSHSEFQKHVNVEADMKPVLEAPVTEVSFLYFASDISSSERSAVGSRVKEVIDALIDTTNEAKAAVCGWSVENDFPVLDREGGGPEAGCAYAIFVGWTSFHAARASWEQAAAGHGEDLRKVQHAAKALKMVTRHLQCREFGQDNGGI